MPVWTDPAVYVAALLAVAMVWFVFSIRRSDLPAAPPPSPFRHLDERKAAVYENLRDLQFEYRLGKLSDADYQQTKQDLQKELAGVMAEIDNLKRKLGVDTTTVAPSKKSAAAAVKTAAAAPAPGDTAPSGVQCPHCGASFKENLKFCGECGKPIQ